MRGELARPPIQCSSFHTFPSVALLLVSQVRWNSLGDRCHVISQRPVPNCLQVSLLLLQNTVHQKLSSLPRELSGLAPHREEAEREHRAPTPGATPHANTFQPPGKSPWRAMQMRLYFLLLLDTFLFLLTFSNPFFSSCPSGSHCQSKNIEAFEAPEPTTQAAAGAPPLSLRPHFLPTPHPYPPPPPLEDAYFLR